MQAVAELGIVHPRLPDQQRERLAVAEHDRPAVRRSSCDGSVRHPVGIVVASASARSACGIAKMSGMSSLSAGPIFTPTGPTRPAGARAPATWSPSRPRSSRRSSSRPCRPVSRPSVIQQFEIDVGDVVDAVDPVRQARFAEARMRRRDQPGRAESGATNGWRGSKPWPPCRNSTGDPLPDSNSSSSTSATLTVFKRVPPGTVPCDFAMQSARFFAVRVAYRAMKSNAANGGQRCRLAWTKTA